MNCTECQELLPLIPTAPSWDDLDPNWRDALQQHIRDCSSCRQEFRDLSESFASFAWELEPLAPPHGFTERIMQRISESSTLSREPSDQGLYSEHPTQPDPMTRVVRDHVAEQLTSGQRRLSYAIAAGLLFMVVAAQWLYLQRLRTIADASQDPEVTERVESIEKALADLQQFEQQAREARIRFVAFQLSSEDARVQAHAVWDELAGQLHLFAFGMPSVAPNRTYTAWFVYPGETALGKSFLPDGDGNVNILIDSPLPINVRDESRQVNGAAPLEVIVTVEQVPVPAQPSDQIWMRAVLQ